MLSSAGEHQPGDSLLRSPLRLGCVKVIEMKTIVKVFFQVYPERKEGIIFFSFKARLCGLSINLLDGSWFLGEMLLLLCNVSMSP